MNGMDDKGVLREEMRVVGRRMYEKGFIAGMDGNLSVRVGEGLLVTRSGVCKGELGLEDILEVDLEGRKKCGGLGVVTSELELHLEVYRRRVDVRSVVHAHPPKSLSVVISGGELSRCVLPEVIVSLGRVPVVGYEKPSSKELGESIGGVIEETDILILDMHGSVAVGVGIWEAYYKLETLEHWAGILIDAKLLGNVRELRKEQVDELMELRAKYGLKGKVMRCDGRVE